MSKDLFEYYDRLDGDDAPGYSRSNPKGVHTSAPHISKKVEMEEQGFISAQDSSRATFQFTYAAARFESWWLLESLNDFYEHQWIADVLRRVKGGKEASVYQCRGGAALRADLAAAKVYRPRSMRNLRNDGLYREGRTDLDADGRPIVKDGMLRAIKNKTQYGRELQHQSWVAYEFTAMQELYAAGADIPEPHSMAKNAILMEFIGDLGSAAPALNEIRLVRSEARFLFDRVLKNLEILLRRERIHGDLSAYNILYWKGRIALIDFPQVVSPNINRHAYKIFSRDVARVSAYFAKQGIKSDPSSLAPEIWTSCGYRLPRPEPEEEPLE
jgi:RIO kinase 1